MERKQDISSLSLKEATVKTKQYLKHSFWQYKKLEDAIYAIIKLLIPVTCQLFFSLMIHKLNQRMHV